MMGRASGATFVLGKGRWETEPLANVSAGPAAWCANRYPPENVPGERSTPVRRSRQRSRFLLKGIHSARMRRSGKVAAGASPLAITGHCWP